MFTAYLEHRYKKPIRKCLSFSISALTLFSGLVLSTNVAAAGATIDYCATGVGLSETYIVRTALADGTGSDDGSCDPESVASCAVCSLPEAIIAANSDAGPSRITFDSTVNFIAPSSELPAMTASVCMDGNGTVEINGSSIAGVGLSSAIPGGPAKGLSLMFHSNSTIQNMKVTEFNTDSAALFSTEKGIGIHGFFVDDVTIRNNETLRNVNAGISFIVVNNSLIEDNTSMDNDPAPQLGGDNGTGIFAVVASPPSVITGNTSNNNGGRGFLIGEAPGSSGTGFTVTNNTANGNGSDGILYDGPNCVITGNITNENAFGRFRPPPAVDASGANSGIEVARTGDGCFIDNNIMKGNRVFGLFLWQGTTNTTATNNLIEDTGALGTGVLFAGVWLGGGPFGVTNNLIADNTIRNNIGIGIGISSSTAGPHLNNAFLNNSISGTLDASGGDPTSLLQGLGIELFEPGIRGVTPNDLKDADSGANNLQNFPTFEWAHLKNGELSLHGHLKTERRKDYRIDFYANSQVDASGHGEGERPLGFICVATNNGGNSNFKVSQSNLRDGSGAPVNIGDAITATATEVLAGDCEAGTFAATYGSTSEFSAAQVVTAP